MSNRSRELSFQCGVVTSTSALTSRAALLTLFAAGGVFGCGSSSGGSAPCTGASCGMTGGNEITEPAPSSMNPDPGNGTPLMPQPTPMTNETPETSLPIDDGMMPAPSDQGPTTTLVNLDAANLLELVVKFYGAQRSGDGNNWLLGGASCHLDDGESIMQDLSGGWYDAGDHVKVTL